MTLSPQFVPQTPDSSLLLNSVSPTALIRADGWEQGAKQIEVTLGKFEAVMNIPTPANDNRALEALAA